MSLIPKGNNSNGMFCLMMLKMFSAMHFIYYINRSIATKVDSTYLGY